MIRKDCFAYFENSVRADYKGCKVIKQECFAKEQCDSCPFYKTQQQLERENEKTRQRLAELKAVTSPLVNV